MSSSTAAVQAAHLLRTAGLTGLVHRASERAEPDPGRTLPVVPGLRPLLPGGGLRRGATVAVTGGTSILVALLAEASAAGSWCAVVGVPTLGLAAVGEAGVALDRLALVPYPGPEWPAVTAALLDGFDVVVVRIPGRVAAPVARRLAARARQRGGVLVAYGELLGAETTLRSAPGGWAGLGDGRGRLRTRHLTVVAQGRGGAVRPRRVDLAWPASPGGEAAAVLPFPSTGWVDPDDREVG